MSLSRALVVLSATIFVGQLIFRHPVGLHGDRGGILLNRFLAALEALGGGPRSAYSSSYEQSDYARGNAGRPPLRRVDGR